MMHDDANWMQAMQSFEIYTRMAKDGLEFQARSVSIGV